MRRWIGSEVTMSGWRRDYYAIEGGTRTEDSALACLRDREPLGVGVAAGVDDDPAETLPDSIPSCMPFAE